MFAPGVTILSFCEAMRGVQLAIGNAPWPMGVSMAGIHERSGRDKLTEKNSARTLLPHACDAFPGDVQV